MSPMPQFDICIATSGRGTYELTGQVRRAVSDSGVASGLCHVFLRHTSASLMLCENADPAVLRDLEAFMSRLTPDGDPLFTHTAEGPDDMPAHLKSVLLGSGLTLPVRDGRFHLGTWQGIYLCEHRDHGGARRLVVTCFGAG